MSTINYENIDNDKESNLSHLGSLSFDTMLERITDHALCIALSWIYIDYHEYIYMCLGVPEESIFENIYNICYIINKIILCISNIC